MFCIGETKRRAAHRNSSPIRSEANRAKPPAGVRAPADAVALRASTRALAGVVSTPAAVPLPAWNRPLPVDVRATSAAAEVDGRLVTFEAIPWVTAPVQRGEPLVTRTDTVNGSTQPWVIPQGVKVTSRVTVGHESGGSQTITERLDAPGAAYDLDLDGHLLAPVTSVATTPTGDTLAWNRAAVAGAQSPTIVIGEALYVRVGTGNIRWRVIAPGAAVAVQGGSATLAIPALPGERAYAAGPDVQDIEVTEMLVPAANVDAVRQRLGRPAYVTNLFQIEGLRSFTTSSARN